MSQQNPENLSSIMRNHHPLKWDFKQIVKNWGALPKDIESMSIWAVELSAAKQQLEKSDDYVQACLVEILLRKELLQAGYISDELHRQKIMGILYDPAFQFGCWMNLNTTGRESDENVIALLYDILPAPMMNAVDQPIVEIAAEAAQQSEETTQPDDASKDIQKEAKQAESTTQQEKTIAPKPTMKGAAILDECLELLAALTERNTGEVTLTDETFRNLGSIYKSLRVAHETRKDKDEVSRWIDEFIFPMISLLNERGTRIPLSSNYRFMTGFLYSLVYCRDMFSPVQRQIAVTFMLNCYQEDGHLYIHKPYQLFGRMLTDEEQKGRLLHLATEPSDRGRNFHRLCLMSDVLVECKPDTIDHSHWVQRIYLQYNRNDQEHWENFAATMSKKLLDKESYEDVPEYLSKDFDGLYRWIVFNNALWPYYTPAAKARFVEMLQQFIPDGETDEQTSSELTRLTKILNQKFEHVPDIQPWLRSMCDKYNATIIPTEHNPACNNLDFYELASKANFKHNDAVNRQLYQGIVGGNLSHDNNIFECRIMFRRLACLMQFDNGQHTLELVGTLQHSLEALRALRMDSKEAEILGYVDIFANYLVTHWADIPTDLQRNLIAHLATSADDKYARYYCLKLLLPLQEIADAESKQVTEGVVQQTKEFIVSCITDDKQKHGAISRAEDSDNFSHIITKPYLIAIMQFLLPQLDETEVRTLFQRFSTRCHMHTAHFQPEAAACKREEFQELIHRWRHFLPTNPIGFEQCVANLMMMQPNTPDETEEKATQQADHSGAVTEGTSGSLFARSTADAAVDQGPSSDTMLALTQWIASHRSLEYSPEQYRTADAELASAQNTEAALFAKHLAQQKHQATPEGLKALPVTDQELSDLCIELARHYQTALGASHAAETPALVA